MVIPAWGAAQIPKVQQIILKGTDMLREGGVLAFITSQVLHKCLYLV